MFNIALYSHTEKFLFFIAAIVLSFVFVFGPCLVMAYLESKNLLKTWMNVVVISYYIILCASFLWLITG